MIDVSVIIPARNAEAFVGDAIDSVSAQTSSATVEVVLIDDGSLDRTAEVGRSRGATTIAGPARGVSAARNLGVSHAQGRYIAFLDADDLWKPDKLYRQLEYLERHADIGCVGTGCELFGATAPRELVLDDDQIRGLQPVDFLTTCRMYPSSFLLRREVARQVEFPVDLGDAEDLVYLAMLRRLTLIGAVSDCLFLRRVHPGQVTRGGGHLARALNGRLLWLKSHWQELGTDLDTAERAVVDATVNDVWIDYWLGHFAQFRAARHDLIAGWPPGIPVPDGLTRRVLPGWLVRTKRAAEHLFGRSA